MPYLPATNAISVPVGSLTHAKEPHQRQHQHDATVAAEINLLGGQSGDDAPRNVETFGCDGLGRPLRIGARASLRLRTPQGTHIVAGTIRSFDHDGIEVIEGPAALGMYHKAQADDVRLL